MGDGADRRSGELDIGEFEPGTAVASLGRSHLPAVGAGDLSDDRQPEPGSVRRVRVSGLENAVLLRLRNAASVVFDVESDLVVEMPIPINDDGSMRITYLGGEGDFQELYERSADAASLGVEVIETGEYEPDVDAFMRGLTPRQQEVLQAAVEVGYYSEPRGATHEDVAEAVGIAPTTAGTHLRKIESRVFGALVR